MITEASPLQWPSGWQRSPSPRHSSFGVGNSKPSIARATDKLMKEIRLMGGTHIVVSSNLRLKNDGTPYSSQREPDDQGVAVYFTYQGQQRVVACDSYARCGCNLFAIAKTIEAMRAIDRWGCSEILARAFTGFAALPPPCEHWSTVLDVIEELDNLDVLKSAYRQKVKQHHPDNGGDATRFQQVQQAYKEARKDITELINNHL
jgi:hypothetical protein